MAMILFAAPHSYTTDEIVEIKLPRFARGITPCGGNVDCAGCAPGRARGVYATCFPEWETGSNPRQRRSVT